jgi:hypothetical protein
VGILKQPRRVQVQDVARFELLGFAGPVLAEGRPLASDDPRKRLAICDRQEVGPHAAATWSLESADVTAPRKESRIAPWLPD